MSAHTYSVPVTGPSAALAFARALALKAAAVAKVAWAKTRLTLSTVVRLPGAVAAGVQAVLSTTTGYRATTGLIRAAARSIWAGVRATARLVGRVFRTAAHTATTGVGYLSADGADWMVRTTDTVATRVTGWAKKVDDTVTTAADVAWSLLHTPLVRATATTTATVASALVTLHWVTQGAAAACVVKALPFLMDAVLFLTNPTRSLLLVAAATAAAMAVAVGRMMTATRSPAAAPPPAEDSPQPDSGPTPQPQQQPQPVTLPDNWEAIVEQLRIEVRGDGSVVVHGIPNSVPRAQGELIARIATDAAHRQFTRTRKIRPYPSRDDKRLFTKVAREAVRKEAHRNGPGQQAA